MTEPVDRFYDQAAASYHQQYDESKLYDLTQDYPANHFRLKLLLKSFAEKKVKRVIEVGCGEGTPLAKLGKMGMEVSGFDISHEMVERTKERMVEHSIEPLSICWGDIQDASTYTHAFSCIYDGLIAMGVMPHVEDDGIVLDNMGALVRPGGSVFIEFRNKLFSLFTFNRHTYDFILNDLLDDVADELKDLISVGLLSRVRYDLPQPTGYDNIISRFHNPLEMTDLFHRHGFTDVRFLWYHYHPAMPYLEQGMPELFRKEAIRLEGTSDWRGMFLCSAFIVEAVKE